jgi:hypothetical protein
MKQNWIVVAALAAALAGCSNRDWHGEAFSRMYPQPNQKTEQQLDERQAIMHWTTNPREKERVGYLEKYSITLAGSREPHDIYYIRDGMGMKTLGYISENGAFFRYTKDGQAERIGEYPIRDVGIRIFFGFPKSDNLAFEDIPTYSSE